MRIHSLKLANFKRFAAFETTFSDGLTVVRGENEQGKSTLLSAIFAGLFYDPARRNQAIAALKSWGSEELCRIEMRIGEGEDTYLIQKDFEQKFFALTQESSKRSWTTVQEAKPTLLKLLGTEDPTLFEATAAVRQDALARIHEGKKELEEAMQSFVTSGGESVSAVEVLRLLEKKLREAEKGLERPTLNPGAIRRLQDEEAALLAKTQELETIVTDRARRQQENETLRARGEEHKTQLAVKQHVLDGSKERREAIRKQEEWNAVFETAQRAQEALTQAGGAGAQVTQLDEKLEMLERTAMAWQELEGQRKAVARELAGLKVAEEFHEPRALQNPALIGGLVLLAVAVGGFRFSLWFALALLPAAVLCIWAFRKQAHVKARKQEQVEENHIRAKETELTAKQQRMLTEQRLVSVEALQEERKRVSQEREMALGHTARAQALTKGKTAEQWEEERMTAARELAVLKTRLKELEGITVDAQGEAKLRQEHDRLQEEVQQSREQWSENQGLIKASPASSEELLQAKERLAEVQEELARERMLAQAYKLAIDVIGQSKEVVTKKAKGMLEQLMADYLPRITKGRYLHASVDDNLQIKVDTGAQQGGEVTPEEVLSRGTVDQIYLVARLALLRLLYPNTRPPLLLDDPFVAFDDVRKAMTMEILSEIAKEQQVILFTHSPTYDAWADSVITLGA